MDYCVVQKNRKFHKFLDIARSKTLGQGNEYVFNNDMEMKSKVTEIPCMSSSKRHSFLMRRKGAANQRDSEKPAILIRFQP
jgi:hypothetical protein